MPAIKTVIVFDQYSVPVSMNKAIVDTDIQFHEYHIEDRRRTSRKTVCSGCGRELTAGDIVKGYEYDEGCLVLLDKDELKQLKIGTENCITVLCTTSLNQIPPVYYGDSYVAAPVAGSEKIFEITRLALTDAQKTLIGRSVTGGVDSYVAVSPTDEGLLVTKLHLENELSKSARPYKKPPVSESELHPVKALLNDMDSAFDMSGFENAYQNNLRAFLSSKITLCQEPKPEA